MDEVVKYLRALVALQLQPTRPDEGVAPVRPEVTLSKAGFTAREIAELTGKTQAAVAKALSRAKFR